MSDSRRVGATWVFAEEKCQKIVKEQEFKIRKLKEKMAGIAPTKKNKANLQDGKAKSWVIFFCAFYDRFWGPFQVCQTVRQRSMPWRNKLKNSRCFSLNENGSCRELGFNLKVMSATWVLSGSYSGTWSLTMVKEQLDPQADGNYRAAMGFVRKVEEDRIFGLKNLNGYSRAGMAVFLKNL